MWPWQATISESDLPIYYTNPYRVEIIIIKAVRYLRYIVVGISQSTGGEKNPTETEMQTGDKENKLNAKDINYSVHMRPNIQPTTPGYAFLFILLFGFNEPLTHLEWSGELISHSPLNPLP